MIHPRPTVTRPHNGLSPARVVVLSFTAFVLLGSLLLSLPVCHAGAPHAFIDDLFTATSAVCVTGLATIDPATRYSPLGHTVLAMLIQVGGLGYMTLFTFAMILAGKRLSMRDRLALQEATDQPGLGGLVRHVLNIFTLTLAFEAIGLALLATQTVPEYGWKGLGMAAFFTISAFNNAGFSLMSDSAMHWQAAPVFLLTLAALTIVGGLGYNVNRELVNRYVFRQPPQARWNVLIAVVLGLTPILLVGATLVIFALEAANPKTLGALPPALQWLNAFFTAVQPRTSGFNSLDMPSLTPTTQVFLIPLMFLGTGPGGTGGGIKLTTFAVLLMTVYATMRGQNDVTFPWLRRRVGEQVVRKAVTAFFLSILLCGAAALALAALHPTLSFLGVLFEVISAFATVGLSVGVTGQLGDAGKLIIAGMMLAGRIGALMLVFSLVPSRRKSAVRYSEEPLLVG